MSKSKILTVDDRRVDRILYMELLGHDLYDFSELDDGEKLIEFLNGNKVDLILLDWQMPIVGGLEALKLIKKHPDHKNIPVIIITGLEEDRVLEQAFDYGGVDFLHKPVKKVELVSRVESALRLHKAQESLRKQKEQLQELNDIITVQKEELQASLKIKEELAELKRLEMQRELDDKKRKLMTMEVESSKVSNHINSIIKEVTKNINILRTENSESAVIKSLRKLEKNLKDVTEQEDNWGEFKKVFESTHPDFFTNLMKKYPKLTSLDLKHCSYLKMNIDNYELSSILGVELKSIQMTRYRLKKKLKLDTDMSLREYIHTI